MTKNEMVNKLVESQKLVSAISMSLDILKLMQTYDDLDVIKYALLDAQDTVDRFELDWKVTTGGRYDEIHSAKHV
jgi:hypothetical protein